MLSYRDYILAISRCRSFSKAAEQLHISQPWLSAAIKKTEQDRLAKVMRKRLRDEGIDEGVTVVYSPEPPVTDIQNGIIPSISYMPATAGLRIAGEIIQNLIK